ncbi:MAG: acyltransferase family protein [Protaetiibacter sp.]
MTVVAERASAERETADAVAAFRAPYRPELEGLRAVAILLVAASHLWWGRISGGIDVFLVVSGYLITVTLVIRWVRTGSVGAVRYLRSLAARLLPAAIVVLGSIAVGAIVLAASRPSLASDVLRSVGSSALFVQNWYLAIATDGYLSSDRVLNPAEHFWALSMQVQFYLAWLVLVALLSWALRRGSTALRRRRIAVTAIAAVTSASWVWSLVETLQDQAHAYLDTSARIWEFGVGGLLALLGARLVPGRVWSVAIGWLGLAMVVGLGFLGDFDPWFPGIASLWPVAGTALVLLGANGGAALGAHRLLGSRPAVWLGGLAFGLYLWHWPVVSWLAILQNRREFSAVDGISIVLMSLIVAWFMKRLLEQPWQRWGRRTPWAAIVATAAVVVLGATSVLGSQTPAERAAATDPPTVSATDSPAPPIEYLDADGVFHDTAELRAAVLESIQWRELPDGLLADADADADAYGEESCVHHENWDDACTLGTPDAEHTAVILGDSVAGSWLPALAGALGPDWRIVMATEGACPASTVASYYDGQSDPSWAGQCAAIRDEYIARMVASGPDLIVLTSSSRTLDRLVSGASGDAAEEEWRLGTEETLRELASAQAALVVAAPPPLGVATCGTADFEAGGSRCIASLTSEWQMQSSAERAAAATEGAAYLDTRRWFCTDAGSCPWALDGSVVRVDTHHLTAEFSARLAAVMRTALLDAVPELPDVGVRG